MVLSSNALKEITIGALAITVVVLFLMIVVVIPFETYYQPQPPAKLFPLTVPEIWQAAYGQFGAQQQQEEEASTTSSLDSYFVKNKANLYY